MNDGIYLFSSNTCPNCKMSKILLDKKGISYVEINASENKDLCFELNIKLAPTLVVVKNNNIDFYENLSNIKKYIEG